MNLWWPRRAPRKRARNARFPDRTRIIARTSAIRNPNRAQFTAHPESESPMREKSRRAGENIIENTPLKL